MYSAVGSPSSLAKAACTVHLIPLESDEGTRVQFACTHTRNAGDALADKTWGFWGTQELLPAA